MGVDARHVKTEDCLLLAAEGTEPHYYGMMVIDESGDRNDGIKTAHIARQYVGSTGKADNGIMALSSLWTDEHVYYPLHVEPYTPAERLPQGKQDPTFVDHQSLRRGPVRRVECLRRLKLARPPRQL